LQIGIPVFSGVLGNTVLDKPAKALSLFAPLQSLNASAITIKAIGPNGTSRRLTLGSNFKIRSLILMAQKTFDIAYACELYAPPYSSRHSYACKTNCGIRYFPRETQIFDLEAKVDIMGISHGCTVFVDSRAAAAAAAAAETAAKEAAAKVERAMAEMKLKTEREAAAAVQKRRDAEAIAAASFELSAMFDKALSHLGSDTHANASLGGGGAAVVANRVENVVELHETLLDLCSKAEALTARVPQIKSVAKIVEPCLMRLLDAINKNRESGELLWLDDATPRTRQSFNR
jgi:hypothetical protein